MLTFAYGSNMDRALMRANCPSAVPLGTATLDGYRFIIAGCGYASIVPRAGSLVHGVVWRLTARDGVALDHYESVETGLYDRHMLTLRTQMGRRTALTYIAGDAGEGRPKPRYMDLVLAAARDWQLPERHLSELVRWVPATTGEGA
jgi:gamma-glutamylcyclotransferase (GGCT)/AIG2-like uncharacterized protein YtfP